EIIQNVIKKGDDALFEYIKKLDKSEVDKSNILLSNQIRNSYKDKIDYKTMKAFKEAINNITEYHLRQQPNNYELNKNGIKTMSMWKPIESVGLYVPGGNAVYPSSLIMNVVPAKVAGVERIVITTPSNNEEINPYILALIDELNISEVYQVGGAHAIAALAYGTQSIKPVNKIFGPGNAYVASAKRQVFGKVGIDLIAGPSEIVIVADKNNNSKWIAADLIAQAEHDEKAQSILITNDENFANEVFSNVSSMILNLPKKDIIENSLNNHGLIIITDDFNEVEKIINFISPEHLHLQNESRYEIFKKVKNSGGIFIGEYSAEAFGDYIAGTNHILPTSSSSKFSSGLGVLDFMKRISVVDMEKEGYKFYQENVQLMAKVENLEGHKLSVKIRQIEKK
ncbi:histidinol dehydrogenase, partial [Alphaproteobacteria bacterium]|nr:histidinol dehydrogenase [Alphaproteobacteria bacterium]